MLSKVSQPQKDNYYVFFHKYNSYLPTIFIYHLFIIYLYYLSTLYLSSIYWLYTLSNNLVSIIYLLHIYLSLVWPYVAYM